MANRLLGCHTGETARLAFDDERRALVDQDHVTLFEMGAQPVPHAHPVHRHVRARPRSVGVLSWPTVLR